MDDTIAGADVLTREHALALVRHLCDAANRHDTATLMAAYADDAVAVSPQFAELRGRAAIARAWETLFAMFSDCRVEVSDVLVDGNRIAMLGVVTGTDRGGWFGLPSTGCTIQYRINILCTVVNGVIVRDERIYDSAGVVERLEKARLDRELQMAAEVQRALLYRTSFATPFCEVAARSIPCRSIGGDFFDVVQLPAGSVGVVVGDVAGKGPAAALLAAMLQGVFAAEAQGGPGPARTLSRMNQILAARHVESRFATLAYGVLSADGRLVYSNAGHNPPAIVSRNGVRRLTAGGPILGAFADATFEEVTIELSDRDTLLMFSDGITEAGNAGGDEFGDERLLAIATNRFEPPGALVGRIFDAAREFCGGVEQADDMTVAAAQFVEGATETESSFPHSTPTIS